MTNKYDALEELATKACEHGEAIGESGWYSVGELRDMGRIGTGGASRVGAADDAYIAALDPAAVLGLIADVKVLAEALTEISKGAPTKTLEWIESDNHGDTARNAAEMEHHRLSEIARRALARLDGRSCCHHQADCAVHNAPAELPGACDCPALSRIQEPK